ncbi:MAG: transglycosylase SLT domain-containing protein [Rhodobacteraceae bacterium]|nr:transglycosylase SLT domain-containing protein [Paracoccaceae bacterium]
MRRIALGIGIAVAICPGSGWAQDQDATTGFTFHMVKPPTPGAKRFITVQIDPAEQAARLAPPPEPAPPITPAPGTGVAGLAPVPSLPQGSARYGWYWDAVSPAIDDRSGRFGKALAALTLGPDGQSVTAPRLTDMQQIATTYGKEILAATIGTQVSPALALAVIGIESNGNPKAVSSTGAQGLMQLVPATASRFKVGDVFDPAQNIKGGVSYLDWLMKTFDQDPVMVLAAYNAGENAVKSAGGVPAIAETRDYVPKVLAAWTVAQGLCLTPPELVSDGCVFRTAAN